MNAAVEVLIILGGLVIVAGQILGAFYLLDEYITKKKLKEIRKACVVCNGSTSVVFSLPNEPLCYQHQNQLMYIEGLESELLDHMPEDLVPKYTIYSPRQIG